MPECAVCLGKLRRWGCTTTECGHRFHRRCLQRVRDAAVGGGPRCPLCRATLDPVEYGTHNFVGAGHPLSTHPDPRTLMVRFRLKVSLKRACVIVNNFEVCTVDVDDVQRTHLGLVFDMPEALTFIIGRQFKLFVDADHADPEFAQWVQNRPRFIHPAARAKKL